MIDETTLQSNLILCFALPDDKNSPAKVSQCFFASVVVGNILFELLRPKCHSGFGRVCVWASVVSMPETSVDEDCCPIPRKYDVRTSGEIFTVKTEAEPQSVRHTADGELGSGVTSLDSRHDPASSFAVHDVCHFSMTSCSSKQKQPTQSLVTRRLPVRRSCIRAVLTRCSFSNPERVFLMEPPVEANRSHMALCSSRCGRCTGSELTSC